MDIHTDILGITHNLMHAVRCKALAKDTDSESEYDVERVEAWSRLVAKVDEAKAQLAAVTAQRDELLRFARDVRSWLADPKLGTWTYIESSDFYDDKDRFVYDADEAIARAQPEQPQQPQDGAP